MEKPLAKIYVGIPISFYARFLFVLFLSFASCLDAVMVSQHFWPQLLGDDMRLHPSMQKRLEEFSKAYSVIKNPRLLVWKKQVLVSNSFRWVCFTGKTAVVVL